MSIPFCDTTALIVPRHDSVICTAVSNPDDLSVLNFCQDTLERYARQFQWDVLTLKDTRLAPERPPAWDKVVLINALLTWYNVVLWLDADMLFVDYTRDIRQEVPKATTMAIVSHAYNGQIFPDTSVWLMRQSAPSTAILQLLWNQDDLVSHPQWEKAALTRILEQGKIDGVPVSTYTHFLNHRWNSTLKDPSPEPIIAHYRGLSSVANGLRARQAASKSDEPLSIGKQVVSGTMTLFAEREEGVEEWHRPYVQLIKTVYRGGEVLDVACGLGTFLAVCQDEDPTLKLTGIELDTILASLVQDRGISVLTGDAIEVLEGQSADRYYDVIHMSHILEHLTPDRVIRLLELTTKHLRVGGAMIIRTPNWANEIVRSGGFWQDFSHIRPYPLEVLRPIMQRLDVQEWVAGFEPYGWQDVFWVGVLKKPVTKVVIQGAARVIHSLAKVNEHWVRELTTAGYQVAIRETEPFARPSSDIFVESATSRENLHQDVWIGHSWPVSKPPLSYGHKVLYIPWEFYAPLAEWVDRVALCDDVWTTSQYAADGFKEFGLFSRPKVVYPRIDVRVYKPGGAKVNLDIPDDYVRLLFVGGTIWRKGIDVLLNAYTRAFTSRHKVCLIIKDMGTSSFYRGQTQEALIQSISASSAAPRVVYLASDLSEQEIAALYRTSDILVHPYRAEGFGMPILEAMASGLPVIVTEGGPSDEFVSDGVYIKIPATLTYGPHQVGDSPTLGPIQWLEPNTDALVDLLRAAVTQSAAMKSIALERTHHIAQKWSWANLNPQEFLS
ncbi:MAG: hypothetical protein C7B45_04390 [Sulfobacillus acidophilus]|uniref:Glycosyl transferase family 1 domain-containing protein n=1 Tax=Sulfobacillus acidophilus TaxID=53633 RepID=A0A2T2WLB1_9FIRM|nr:MAG: hypothetical protein C7B45_04390 [Sulfobacillus acidophilus]